MSLWKRFRGAPGPCARARSASSVDAYCGRSTGVGSEAEASAAASGRAAALPRQAISLHVQPQTRLVGVLVVVAARVLQGLLVHGGGGGRRRRPSGGGAAAAPTEPQAGRLAAGLSALPLLRDAPGGRAAGRSSQESRGASGASGWVQLGACRHSCDRRWHDGMQGRPQGGVHVLLPASFHPEMVNFSADPTPNLDLFCSERCRHLPCRPQPADGPGRCPPRVSGCRCGALVPQPAPGCL